MEKLTDTFLTRMLFDALDANDQAIKNNAIADAVTVIEKNPRVGTEYMMKRMVDAFSELNANNDPINNAINGLAKIIERQKHKVSNDFALHLTGQMIENDHLAKSLQPILQATLKAQPEFPALVVAEANDWLYDFVKDNQRKNALAIIDTAMTIAPHKTVTEDLVKNLTRRAIRDGNPYKDNAKTVEILKTALHIRHDLSTVAARKAVKLKHDDNLRIAVTAKCVLDDIIAPVMRMPCADVAADKLHILAHGL